MAGSIANLNVRLGLNIANFSASLASAAKPLKSFASSVMSAGSMVTGLAGAATALVAGGSIVALTKHSMEAIDTNAKLADRLGLTTEGLVGLQYAGDLAGASSEMLTGALEKMLKGLGGAADDGELASNAFSKLGLKASELANIPADEAFTQIAQKISEIENPTERATAAMGIFGKSGQALLPLLTSGAEGIKAAQQEAQKLGLTYSRVDAAKVEAANDAMSRAGKIAEGVGNQFAIGLAPYIDAAATKVMEFATQGGGLAPKVGGAIEYVAKSVAFLSDYLNILNAGWNVLRGVGSYALGSVLDVLGLVIASVEYLYEKVTGTSTHFGDGMQTIAKNILKTGDDAFKQAGQNWDDFMNRTNSRAVGQAFSELKAKSDESAKAIGDNAAKMQGAFKGIEDSSKNLQKVIDTLAALQTQVEQAGMTDAQKKVDDLKRLGASPEQIAQAEAALKKLDALSEAKKKAEDMQSKGKSVFDETRTPMEKYTARLDELSELLNAGAIDWDTYGRSVRSAKSELEKSAEAKVADAPDQHLDAIKAGSAAALKFSYDNSRGVQRLNRDDLAKKQLDESQTATKVLERIERNTANAGVQEVDI